VAHCQPRAADSHRIERALLAVERLEPRVAALPQGHVSLAEGELCLYSSAALITAIGGAFGLLAVMALLATCVITLATHIVLAASALIFGAAPRALASLLFKYGMRNFKRHSP